MVRYIIIKSILTLLACLAGFYTQAQVALPGYLGEVKQELKKVFPDNRTINLVFHGHSVPAGYWSRSEVHTLESYPHLLLKKLKATYPHAVINVITTAIGGEYAEKGQKRLATDAFPHRPDVLFIDYALNDLGIGLERSRLAWANMIKEAQRQNIKVILLTPSPDQRYNILHHGNKLELHANQIRKLGQEYGVAVADPFAKFREVLKSEGSVESYMSHVNHPNEKGHELIAAEIFELFK